MDKEKLAKKLTLLFQDKDFVLKLSETKSDEEAVKLFAENDCELEAEKVKFVRDTLMSAINGEIEISEKDLENISGGAEIDYQKVLTVALIGTLIIGGAYAVTRPSAPVPQQPQGSAMGAALAKGMTGLAQAAVPAAAGVANALAQPTWGESLWGVFSRKQRAENALRKGLGAGVVGALGGNPQQLPQQPQ